MHIRDDHPSPGTSRTDRRRFLEASGVLAGAAALFGGAPAAGAADRSQFSDSREEDSHGNLATRSDLLPLAALGDASASRDAGLRRPGQPHRG